MVCAPAFKRHARAANYGTRFATNSSVAKSPTFRVNLIWSPLTLPLYSIRISLSSNLNISTNDTVSPSTFPFPDLRIHGPLGGSALGRAGELRTVYLEFVGVLLQPDLRVKFRRPLPGYVCRERDCGKDCEQRQVSQNHLSTAFPTESIAPGNSPFLFLLHLCHPEVSGPRRHGPPASPSPWPVSESLRTIPLPCAVASAAAICAATFSTRSAFIPLAGMTVDTGRLLDGD